MRRLAISATILLISASLSAFDRDLAAEAEEHLFAARFDAAAEAYKNLLQRQPASALYHDRLVRALLAAHKTEAAYAAAEEAMRLGNDSAAVWTAQGRVAFRRGDLARADTCYRKAVALDPKYPDALVGMSDLYSAVSRFNSAAKVTAAAVMLAPRDTGLILAHSRGASESDRQAQVKLVLAALDPATPQAESLRAYLARDTAIAGRKRKLLGDINSAHLKLVRLMNGFNNVIGVGLDVRFNDQAPLHLKLDSGASGISISPQAAKRAGLEVLTEGGEVKGLGDKAAERSVSYFADHVRIGPLEWENVAIPAFRSAKDSDADGLIGTDVFSAFRVIVDFSSSSLTLERRTPPGEDQGEADAEKRPEGFTQVFRFGHMLLLPTSLNDGPPRLFLIDSGSMLNLVDIRAAKDSTKVYQNGRVKLTGVQGEVKDVRSADKGRLVFAGFRQENPDLTAVDLQRMSDDVGVEVSGVLGMSVLWHLKMTIDYASGSVRFERGQY